MGEGLSVVGRVNGNEEGLRVVVMVRDSGKS